MKKMFILALGLCVCFGVAVSNVNADTVYLKGESTEKTNVLFNKESYPIRTSPKELEYRLTADQKTPDLVYGFCADIGAKTHAGLATGRVFNEEKLEHYVGENGHGYGITTSQASMIQDLYNHVYASLFSYDPEVGYDITELDMDKAQAFQIVLWEILHETTDTLSLDKGTFQVLNWAPTQDGGSAATWSGADLKAQVETILACLDDENEMTWTDAGFKYLVCDVTVFWDPNAADSASQIMVSGIFDTDPNVTTPEPATLLVLGLGAGCLVPLARRRMKNA